MYATLGLEGTVRVTDTADAFAYNLGLLVKPTDNLKFGFSYRSRVDLRFDNADAKFGGTFSHLNRESRCEAHTASSGY